MKIGVLVNTINQLDNWQLRIIEGIYKDSKLEVVVLINDTVNIDWRLSSSSSLHSKNSKLSGLSGFLLKTQLLIENRYLFKKTYNLNSYLDKITTVKLESTNKNGTASYTQEGITKIKNLKVDLLLNLSSEPLVRDLLSASKHGAWELLFKDCLIDKSGPVGFWEVLKKIPVIGATLIKLSANSQEYSVLDTAYFNRHWSMTETATIVSEGSVSLLFKYLHKLKNNELATNANLIHINSENKHLTLFVVVNYLLGFYVEFFKKVYEKLMANVFDRRYECWTIFTGVKGFFQDVTSFALPLKMPKDEFWADPFLFQHNDKDYLFFENYSYTTKRGKISCGILKNNELTDVIDVLDFKYHLSFPFIFKEDGEVFLMPESSENKTLEIYKAVEFPVKWELYSIAFEGESVGDAFFYTDKEKQKWLFLNKQAATTSPMNSELFIYKVDSIKLKTLIPHKQNPVLIDASIARNGGSIFEHDGNFYRPSQRNTDGIYGRALNINRIEKLTLEEYIETTVQVIEPDFDKKLMGLHHLHKCNGKFVFDAAYRYK